MRNPHVVGKQLGCMENVGGSVRCVAKHGVFGNENTVEKKDVLLWKYYLDILEVSALQILWSQEQLLRA